MQCDPAIRTRPLVQSYWQPTSVSRASCLLFLLGQIARSRLIRIENIIHHSDAGPSSLFRCESATGPTQWSLNSGPDSPYLVATTLRRRIPVGIEACYKCYDLVGLSTKLIPDDFLLVCLSVSRISHISNRGSDTSSRSCPTTVLN